MDPQQLGALVNLGVAGVGLYLFVTGKLLSKATSDEQAALYQARIKEGDARHAEMRADRDAWKSLALATERRLDQVVPTVATAIGAPVPSTAAREGVPE